MKTKPIIALCDACGESLFVGQEVYYRKGRYNDEHFCCVGCLYEYAKENIELRTQLLELDDVATNKEPDERET